MRYTLALVLSALCTMSIVAAQNPAPAQPPATPAPAQQQTTQKPSTPAASQSSQAGKVTYTGCLKPGTTADSWTLENAEMASASGSKSSATAATAGTASKTTFGLTVKPSENLKPHTNHKIEVVGTVSPSTAGASSAASSTSSSAPRQNITVESVKMVSATCP